ncbi:hypothetical protein niasHS_017565 [Heterodera schachtii]|uniref:NADH dehydrogenase [ubiquinone] flavoprotein 3, mitochondrial n=2 Tax=Heterodera TaxID=34509 RepID=A0ABD2I018_HETSC
MTIIRDFLCRSSYQSLAHLCRNQIRVYSVEREGAGTASGIEHALKFNKAGAVHKKELKDYKCVEYLHQNNYSFYDKECELQQFRVVQPTNKSPDTEPKFKSS